MRVYVLFILAAIILLSNSSAVSGSTTNLRASQNLTQLTAAAEPNSGRVLRVDAKTEETIDPDDEERVAITDLVKKLGTGTKAWFKDKNLSLYVHLKALSTKMDKTVQKFIKRNIDPDQLYNLYNLRNPKNWSTRDGHTSAEYTLWEKLTVAWKRVHST